MFFTMVQGQTDPPYLPTLVDNQGKIFDLTNYTASAFTIKFVRMPGPGLYPADGTVKTGGSGSLYWTIMNAPGGQVMYQWQTSDTNTPGNWQVFVYMTTLIGTTRKFLPDTMTILAAP